MSGLRDRMNRLRGSGSVNSGNSEAASALASNALSEASDKHPAAAAAPGATKDPQRDEAETERLHPEWATFGVQLRCNAAGEFLLRETRYPVSHRHGIHQLMELGEAAMGLSAFHSEPVNAEQLLFLDLETTGLGIGAGNVPFMVGIAYLKGEQFVVEQALIRHPAEERAMLAYLEAMLPSFRYLVTYNGKTFDWPVMLNRFIINGRNSRTWEPLHLDFLHPARSIWRNTLTSCKLSHVEEERLGIERIDDVPGSLAPQLYFQYLADGEPDTLKGVFRHNEIDMLSLACLAIRFGHLLANKAMDETQDWPAPYVDLPEQTEELVRTGLWLEKMGLLARAELLFSLAAKAEEVEAGALLMLAGRDKKAGNWARAVLLWQKAIAVPVKYGPASLNAYVELAMYYEHKLKDYDSALQYAIEALEQALGNPLLGRADAKKRAELDSLKNRKERLQRKAGRMQGK